MLDKRVIKTRCVRAGLVFAMGLSLILGVAPQVQESEYFEPSRVAGASRLPIVDWRTTEVKPVTSDVEISIAASPIVEEPKQEEPQVQEPVQEEIPEPVVETYSIDVPVYDKTFFELVVQAEGYTMGYQGMRYIASAIINLARSRGCSVDAVLTSGAYTVVNNGSVWRQNLYSETIAAVEDELYGGQIDTEIKYFRTNYYHGFGTPCFNWGNVYFSK